MLPKVSIQIPTYNQSQWIVRTIESALAQTYENLEVVVLNDASPDSTQELVEKLSNSKLKVYRNEKNIGRVKTYHRLLTELTSGEWIINLDGDDYFTDVDFIKNAVEHIQNHNDVSWLMTNHSRLSAAKQHCKSMSVVDDNTIIVNGTDYIEHYHKIRSFSHMGSLYNKKKAIAAKFYTSDCLITDFVSMMRLCKFGSIICSSRKTGEWNENDNSDSKNSHKEKELAKNIEGLKDLCAFFGDVFTDTKLEKIKANLIGLHLHYSNISKIRGLKGWSALGFFFRKFEFSLNGLHLLTKIRL